MSRTIPVLCIVSLVGIGLTAWSQLNAGNTNIAIPKGGKAAATGTAASVPDGDPDESADHPLAADLRRARRRCDLAAFTPVLAAIKQATVEAPEAADNWHLLAEAYLERVQQHAHLRGVSVGKPVYDKLPSELKADLDAGLAAVAKAREFGDKTGALCRIEAGLMSQHITGLASAVRWNGKIGRVLELAAARAGDDPTLHTALGLRKLLAPKWFGHNPEVALEHFEFAIKRSNDERPAVFAAMATYLQKKRQQAIGWLERAVERNPENRYAQVCLRRLRRGEEQPFGRDVTAAELAALKK